MSLLKNARFHVIGILILMGAFSRLIPHPFNFTAIAATGMFGGFYLKNFKQAVLVVFGAMFLSDFVLGFHALIPVVYIALLIPIALGQKAQNSRVIPAFTLIGIALISSVSFFFITNLAVWCFTSLYPKTLTGLFVCFEAAIPFFKNQVMGDLFYTGVIFGLFFICKIWIPQSSRGMTHSSQAMG